MLGRQETFNRGRKETEREKIDIPSSSCILAKSSCPSGTNQRSLLCLCVKSSLQFIAKHQPLLVTGWGEPGRANRMGRRRGTTKYNYSRSRMILMSSVCVDVSVFAVHLTGLNWASLSVTIVF